MTAKSLTNSNKEPSSPPKRPMNIHISASHNALAPPPLKAIGSKISPLANKHSLNKPSYTPLMAERKEEKSCADNNKNNIHLKLTQTKMTSSTNGKLLTSSIKSSSSTSSSVSAAATKSSAASNASSSSSSSSSHHHLNHHATGNSTLTTSFTTSKSFPLFCNNNNHSKWIFCSDFFVVGSCWFCFSPNCFIVFVNTISGKSECI